MPNLTPYQKKALNHSKHISLTANAGSGKTFVLARRFLSILLEENISLNNIVAITFTEKAASELYKKIADELESRIVASAATEDERKLTKLRRELVSAKISTIHSFCTEILKEFPTEAGIDANFIPIDQRVSDELIVLAIEEIISSSLRNENELTKYIKSNIRLFGSLDTLKQIIKKMINQRGVVSSLRENIYNNDSKLIAENLNRIFIKYFNKLYSESIKNVIVAIRIINNKVIAISKENEFASQITISLEDLDFENSLFQSIKILNELFSNLLVKSGGVRAAKYLSKNNRDELINEIELVENFYSEFKSINYSENYKDAELALANFGNDILIIWEAVAKRYFEKKHAKGYLDFEDLLLFSELLVQRDDVKSYLAQRYEYFMIDEYQDTNEIQFNIFIPILDYLKRGNLFIVGDEKQSIYMFRGADLQIFNKTKEIIRERTDDASLLQLPHSFRLSAQLTLFTNSLFTQLFANPNILFNEVGYDELICARSNSSDGEIAFLISDGTEETESENELVVSKIIELVKNRDADFKDIAILSRKRKSFTALEAKLLERDIPYRIYGGKGFYQQQEIYDIYNYLLFLTNPNNDEALIAILRSPFFMISDSELYEISKTNGNSFWEKLNNSSTKYSNIIHELMLDIQKSKSAELSILIREILTTKGYFSKVVSKQNGNQILANLDKLISSAISFMNKGSVTLYDFVVYLKEFINKTEDESLATIGDDENIVKLMTIHASKGLEFPIVFLIDTNSKVINDQIKSKSISIDKEFGLLTKLPIDNYFEEYSSAPIVGVHNFIAQKKSIAEAKRLLYVAVTRAENYLFVSATAKRKADGSQTIQKDSFLQLFKDGLRFEDLSSPISLVENITFMKEVENEFIKTNKLITLSIPFITNINNDLNISLTTNQHNTTSYNLQIDTIDDIPENEIISATKISVFHQCPLKFQLIYDIGYTSLFYDGKEDEEAFDFTNENNDENTSHIPANIKGSIVHKILEEDVPINKLDERIVELLNPELKNSELVTSKNDIFKLISNYYNSTIYNEIKNYKRFYNEYEIYIKHKDFYLYGIIDKLIVENNKAIIIDYKTDSLKKYSAKEKLENYKYQLLFYAFLIHKMLPKIKEIKCLLLFVEEPSEEAVIKVTENMLDKFESEMLDGIASMRIEKYNKKKSHCKSCYFSDSKNNCVVK
jgi:ATP-dependent helicase/nuclease subunit A